MGQQKRYAERVARRMSEQTDQIIMRDRAPESLTQRELELDRLALTRAPVAIPVRAWVHYGTIALQVEAECVAWTSRTCAIRWRTEAGVEHRAWVWSSAVERLTP